MEYIKVGKIQNRSCYQNLSNGSKFQDNCSIMVIIPIFITQSLFFWNYHVMSSSITPSMIMCSWHKLHLGAGRVLPHPYNQPQRWSCSCWSPYEIIFTATTFNGSFYKIKDYKQNDPWNVERFLEDLLLVVKGQSNLDIDGYLWNLFNYNSYLHYYYY